MALEMTMNFILSAECMTRCGSADETYAHVYVYLDHENVPIIQKMVLKGIFC